MEVIKPTPEEWQFCMRDPKCIRNVCILAHVDHGKTTIADSLLATNRLVSKKMAGFLRYLDDRPDEQEKGITMKSSAVSLLNIVYDEDSGQNKKVLLNLIDTPGHIDFSSEVSAALRVSDGALVLVDLVEGVCVQTRESIKQAFEENTKMILVLNKFDRLITELHKSIEEIFQIILRVIEGCNAIVAELYQYVFVEGDVDIEDTGLLFSPDTGNIIFASGLDGWGFTTQQIAKMFVHLAKDETVDSLNKKMWNFDYYIDSKKEIKPGGIEKKKTNLFIQFCLKTIVQIYEIIVIRMERDKVNVIAEKLNIPNVTRDMTHTNPEVQLRAILQAWKPIANTIMLQCLKMIPSPCQIEKRKIYYLLNVNRYCEDQYLSKCVENVVPYFENMSSTSTTPCLVYVSKMFCVNKKNLSQNKPKIFIPRPRTAGAEGYTFKELAQKPEEKEKEPIKEPTSEEDISVIALARVFTGSLKIGQEMYILSPKYIPDEEKILENPEEFVNNNKYIEKTTIKELYMLFGRELMLVDSIAAGNFCGIGGLEGNIIRTATLSNILNIVPLTERISMEPVMRHAIEPANPKDLPVLRDGLKLLMQSDSCVQVMMQETGELILLTAGDVHLGKCIEDLTKKFAKVELQISSPMVALKETIVNPSADYDFLIDASRSVLVETPYFNLSVITVHLPESIAEVIKNNYDMLRIIEQHQRKSLIDIFKQSKVDKSQEKTTKEKNFKSEVTKRGVIRIKEQLKTSFTESGHLWTELNKRIWSVGKMSDSINLLINNVSDYCHNIFVETDASDNRTFFDQYIINAFNVFCKAGPLCEEPLMNCAFIVQKFELQKDILPQEITPQVMSSVESVLRGSFKKSFEKQEQRLMEPVFTTDIQVNTNILGKVYTVVSKRHGKVLDAVGMDEQEKSFLVKAQMPVIESDGFANEIRKTTSGQAIPNLRFSHYEIIDGDPFYEPVEEDGDEEDDINIELCLRASKLRKDVRRRKGLPVDDQVVTHAEKQRTLNKKK